MALGAAAFYDGLMAYEAKCYHREVSDRPRRLMSLAPQIDAADDMSAIRQFRAYCTETLCDIDFAILLKDDNIISAWNGARA